MIKQVDVAISSKDMCIVVKGKTDVQIAGYLRNICQYSPYNSVNPGKALNTIWEYIYLLYVLNL